MTMVADSVAGLARELDAMPRGARRAILNALTAAERAALDRQLAGTVASEIAQTHDHSVWLAERIAAVGEKSPTTITNASRQALLRSIAPDATRPQHRGDALATGLPGRSLLGAVGGLLLPKTR